MKILRYICLLYILFICTANAIEKKQTLVFSALDYSANYVIEEAYKRIGIQIKITKYPAERALWMANEGLVDGEVIRIASIQQQYPNLVMVPEPVYFIEPVAFTKKQTLPISGWKSLQSYTIGVMRGMKVVEEGTKGLKTTAVNQVQQVLMLVDEERVEIGVLPRMDLVNLMRRLSIKVNILQPPLARIPLYHFLHKKHHHLAPKVAEALKQMRNEGIIEPLILKFFEEETLI